PAIGRPASLRGRRVPVALLDDYIGRLEPNSSQGPALISRYFTRPLLDLTDVGVYAIGLRGEIAPTPRLRHLGLHTEVGMLAPIATRSLLAQAAVGALTTCDAEQLVPVHLTVHGRTRLELARSPTIADSARTGQQGCGSVSGSAAGSACRSV